MAWQYTIDGVNSVIWYLELHDDIILYSVVCLFGWLVVVVVVVVITIFINLRLSLVSN